MTRGGYYSLYIILAACAAAPPRLGAPLRAQLRPLLGDWRCVGKDGVPARWTFAPDLGGAFVSVRYAQQGPEPLQLAGHLGWDEDAGRLTAGFAASDGTTETGSAGDWDGDELVFFSTLRAGDARLQLRRIFQTTSHGFDWRLEVQQDKAWLPLSEASCQPN